MQKTGSVLLVDSDEAVLEANIQALAAYGFQIATAKSLTEARLHLSYDTPDVVVLETVLSDGDGLHFLSEFRKNHLIPVILLTVKDTHEDRLAGLQAGSNDYMTKPHCTIELQLRVRSFMYLSKQVKAEAADKQISRGSLRLDVVAQAAYFKGEDLRLRKDARDFD